jgi:hypothetical protein
MEASSEEEVVEAVTDILSIMSHQEPKSAFDRWVHRCDWVVIHFGEYYHE